ncbi:MAG: nucleotidyltransferase domain-containing protein [Acidobacteriota bacterium]
MTTEAAIELVRRFARRVEASGIPVESAFLFGSHARGSAGKWSDIDACIVSPVFGKDRHDERVLLLNLRLEVSDLIEPHPMSPQEIAEPLDPLANEIRRQGIRVPLQ